MAEFRMPSLGADMEDAKLVEWLVQPGQAVKPGDVIAVVETAKGAIEVEVFTEGVLLEQLVAPGAIVPVGAAMARINGADKSSPAPRTPLAAAPAPPSPATIASTPVMPNPQIATTRPPASPAARRLAKEHGVDLASVAGSGPNGVVTYGDVASYVTPTQPTQPKTPGVDLTSMRRAIAAAMARSKREIPHYYLSDTVDVGVAQSWVADQNATRAPADRLLIGALFAKAVAKAVRAFPEFNGFFVDDEYHPSQAIHVGVAIAIRAGGLAAPAIHHTADLDVDTLMRKMRDLVGRVRAGRFRSSEIADPTITVTSLGERGVDAVWGVIYPPQVAIVGFGRIAMRPWIVDGLVTARPLLNISLAADHRVSDGHRGALFLDKIGGLLAEPDAL